MCIVEIHLKDVNFKIPNQKSKMRSKARNIGYILDSKDLSKNSRHKKLYGPNELMEQPNKSEGGGAT